MPHGLDQVNRKPSIRPRSTRSGCQARDNGHRKLARRHRKLASLESCATRPRKPYPFRRLAKSPKSPSVLVFRFITAGSFATIALGVVRADDCGAAMFYNLLAGMFSNDLAVDLGTANTLVY